MLTKTKISFEGENMQTRYNVLGYRIDLYFFVYKLAKEIDENGNSDRNVLRQLEKKDKTVETKILLSKELNKID